MGYAKGLAMTKRPLKRLTASSMGRMGGLKRMRMLTAEQRKELAKLAANARWEKQREKEREAGLRE